MKKVYYNEFDKFVGEYLTQLRLEHRYTQEQLSTLIGINRNTYVCYERGTRSIPLNVLKKLCILYHLDFYETFKYVDQEASKKGLL